MEKQHVPYKAGWRWVDTRGKSCQIHHAIQMKEHIKAVKYAKNCVHLHKPSEVFLRRLKVREERENYLSKIPPEK